MSFTNTETSPQNAAKIAAKLRDKAQSLDAKIKAKLKPAIGEQRPTARRNRIAASMRSEGYTLQETQAILLFCAYCHEMGLAMSQTARAIRNVSDVPTWGDQRDQLLKEARQWVQQGQREAQNAAREQEIKTAEFDAQRRKTPGFFPTPPELARVLAHLLDLQDDHRVLEPSAGSGRFCRVLLETVPPDNLCAYEINYSLCELLKAQFIPCQQADFLTIGARPDELFDRVLMNPPFENLADIDHIRHAYQFLKSGGRLVSILGESPFFRSDAKAQNFREWLDTVDATVFPLPEGAFKNSGTMVRCRVVVIDKIETNKPENSMDTDREPEQTDKHSPGDGDNSFEASGAIWAHADDILRLCGTDAPTLYDAAYKERDAQYGEYSPLEITDADRALQSRRATFKDFADVLNDLEDLNAHSFSDLFEQSVNLYLSKK